MQRDLVERRRWIGKLDYLEVLSLAQLVPGPLAAQLAIHLGRVRGRALGATLIGFAFVLRSFLIVLVLAAPYLRFGGLTWMSGAFYGIGVAVNSFVARGASKLAKMSIAKAGLLSVAFAASAIVTAWTESEIVWLFVGSGSFTMFVKAPPKLRAAGNLMSFVPLPVWAIAGIAGLATAATLATITQWFRGNHCRLHRVPSGRSHGSSRRRSRDLRSRLPVHGRARPLLSALFEESEPKGLRRWCDHSRDGAIAGAAFVLGRRAVVALTTVAIALTTLGVLVKFKKLQEPSPFKVTV
jgi:chromate transport protein ChrA